MFDVPGAADTEAYARAVATAAAGDDAFVGEGADAEAVSAAMTAALLLEGATAGLDSWLLGWSTVTIPAKADENEPCSAFHDSRVFTTA
jgi:hypothetical protein